MPDLRFVELYGITIAKSLKLYHQRGVEWNKQRGIKWIFEELP